MSKLFVDEIVHQSSQGSGTITLGASGETVSLASGASQTMAVNTPAFSAKQNADQSISNSSWVKINFQTEHYDTDNAFDNVTNYRFTAPSDGKYFFVASVGIRSGNDQTYAVRLYKNGSAVDYSENRELTGTSSVVIERTSVALDLVASDYIEVYFIHTTGSTQDTYKEYTVFQGYKLIG